MVADLQTGFRTESLDPQHGDLAVDLGLDVRQPDQRVELGQQLVQRLLRLRLRCWGGGGGGLHSGRGGGGLCAELVDVRGVPFDRLGRAPTARRGVPFDRLRRRTALDGSGRVPIPGNLPGAAGSR